MGLDFPSAFSAVREKRKRCSTCSCLWPYWCPLELPLFVSTGLGTRLLASPEFCWYWLRVARAAVVLPFWFKGHGPQDGYWRSSGPSAVLLTIDIRVLQDVLRWKIGDQGFVPRHLPSHVMDITGARKGGNAKRVMRSGTHAGCNTQYYSHKFPPSPLGF